MTEYDRNTFGLEDAVAATRRPGGEDIVASVIRMSRQEEA